MRIVIIGEFSSFSKNLSAGFRALGHECFVFSWGDGFKKIEQNKDNSYIVNSQFNGAEKIEFLKYMIHSTLEFYKLKRKVYEMSKQEKWDSILIINPSFIKRKGKFWQARFTKGMIRALLKSSENVYLSACGGDPPYYEFWDKRAWKNKKLIDLNKTKTLSQSSITHFKYISTFINKVIPVMYDYAEAWRNSVYAQSYTVIPTIPLPVETEKYEPYNEINGKIVVFHGIIRPKAKGTDYIVSAMERLTEKYPDKVECIAKGGLPLSEYLEVLRRTNILIDQTYAASSGMNALYSLAMGKVLLGGNEPENSIEYNYPNIPIVNIGPDSNQIFSELEKLILHPENIIRLSEEGRKYVEKVHDSKVVAQKYIDVFQKFNKSFINV
jgi:glycosyltransferase involved in cell wall biosynthesis